MAESCKFVSVPEAKKAEIKRDRTERKKWKENPSHVEECFRLGEVTLIGVLAVKAGD